MIIIIRTIIMDNIIVIIGDSKIIPDVIFAAGQTISLAIVVVVTHRLRDEIIIITCNRKIITRDKVIIIITIIIQHR